MSEVSGSKVTHNYADFRGVDFTDEEVSINRSPDALNMWKNYHKLGKCIETRPELELISEYDYPVYGMFFYKVGNRKIFVVHSGVYLYKEESNVKTQIYSGMNPKKSKMFVYNNILYILDGLHYLQYDGTQIKEVEGFVPTTSISMQPNGGGISYQGANLLTGMRKNTFCADGESTEYHLDSANEAIDTNYVPVVTINGTTADTSTYSVNYTNGIITFQTAPAEPDTIGQDNVEIKFKKTIPGYRNRIDHCTIAVEFDNRIFFTGNADYPTTIFHGELYDPTYIDSNNYYTDGVDDAPIKSMITGNNALWVFKEPNQSNTSIFYHLPTTYLDNTDLINKAYTSTHSSISTGCVADAVNFNDDICFFSDRGMEAITSDITTEQAISHRSALIDSKLLKESNYKKLLLAEWEGYLLVMVDNHVYLANSNESYLNNARYEWFYWEFSKTPKSVLVKDNVLYIGAEDGIYSLTDFSKNRRVSSYWTTPYDEFGYPQYQKSTNKRGSVSDIIGDNIKMYVSSDKNEFEWFKTHTDIKGYAVNKIKKKKWKGIQLQFRSSKPFELYSCTLEAYIGGYLKR